MLILAFSPHIKVIPYNYKSERLLTVASRLPQTCDILTSHAQMIKTNMAAHRLAPKRLIDELQSFEALVDKNRLGTSAISFEMV